MRRLLLLVALLGACFAAQGRATESFTGSLNPEDFHRAGLDKLSPAERAVLDQLVAQQHAPGAAVVASPEAGASEHSVVVKAGTRVVEEAIETRIDGKFTGWEGKTVFHLQNGQTWQIANSDSSYWCPAVMNPQARITHSSLGGYWMVVEGKGLRVRVRVLPLE